MAASPANAAASLRNAAPLDAAPRLHSAARAGSAGIPAAAGVCCAYAATHAAAPQGFCGSALLEVAHTRASWTETPLRSMSCWCSSAACTCGSHVCARC